jgi:hypothetical protein
MYLIGFGITVAAARLRPGNGIADIVDIDAAAGGAVPRLIYTAATAKKKSYCQHAAD